MSIELTDRTAWGLKSVLIAVACTGALAAALEQVFVSIPNERSQNAENVSDITQWTRQALEGTTGGDNARTLTQLRRVQREASVARNPWRYISGEVDRALNEIRYVERQRADRNPETVVDANDRARVRTALESVTQAALKRYDTQGVGWGDSGRIAGAAVAGAFLAVVATTIAGLGLLLGIAYTLDGVSAMRNKMNARTRRVQCKENTCARRTGG